jgi:hypothetical protein
VAAAVETPAAEPPTVEAAAVETPTAEPPTAEAAVVEAAVESEAVPNSARPKTAPTSSPPERRHWGFPAASTEGLGADSAAPQRPATAPVKSIEAVDPAPPRVRAAPEPSLSESAAPKIDHTQTIRAPVRLDLEDGQASRGFAIQLMLSEAEIDPLEVPNLSIFAEYRLYAVTGIDHDRVMHALRLGFFSSESAAAAVAGYLATFFDAPCIKRVSIAEHERFEERRMVARKDIGDMDGHHVIELAEPRRAPVPQVVLKQPAGAKQKATQGSSIWSRLIPTRKR